MSETGQSQKATTYLGNLIFENNGLLYVSTEEGRARIESGVWKFDYFLKDHLGNVRMMLEDNGTVLEETHYYPFGLIQRGISYTNPTPSLKNKDKTFQGQKFDDDLGLNYYSFKYRNHDPQIGRFIEIDPLANDYVHNSTYAFSENRVINGVELEGLEFFGINPLWGVALESNNVITKGPVVENIVKAGVEVGNKSSKSFPKETLENFSRGNKTEATQLSKNGLDKNTTPIEVVDPKTGQKGITIPDALKNEGKSTVEIKDVKSQGLTRQLRLQEKFSKDNGFKPELMINEGAKLSKPLKNSSFDIKPYSISPVDNTGHKPLDTRLFEPPRPTEEQIQWLKDHTI